MKETLNIACFQQDIVWEQPDANRRLVEGTFAPLGRDADILVVPETFTTGFSDNMAAMAEEPEGETTVSPTAWRSATMPCLWARGR